jgi:hypothetical protein
MSDGNDFGAQNLDLSGSSIKDLCVLTPSGALTSVVFFVVKFLFLV